MTDPMKNPYVIAWVEALESGKYEQGMGQLKLMEPEGPDDEYGAPKYCCLGVACDIFGPLVGRPEGTDESPLDELSKYWWGYDGSLPDEIVTLLGLSDGSGSLLENVVVDPENDTSRPLSLVDLNDGLSTYRHSAQDPEVLVEPRTFKEIAAFIRSNPPGLFRED